LQLKKIVASDSKVRDVYSFLGIPYATPPVGDLRFREPQPLNLWSGIRDAKEFGAVCPQDFSLMDLYPIEAERPTKWSEDCLFLNVWTPTLDSNARLPVMFHIHGGGFASGFSDMCSGDVLANFHDVVVVSINYRLGAIGFLCTGDSVATGNYGLLDQIEALKFVKQHIGCFGGDPDNITIFGISAGAISVSMFIVSPLAQGLFRRAICQSGTCLLLGFAQTPQAGATLLGTLLDQISGFPGSSSSSSEIINFLRQQPVEGVQSLSKDRFRPVLTAPFLPSNGNNIRDLLTAAKCDCELMIGCNNDEGYLVVNVMSSMTGMSFASLDVPTTRALLGGVHAVLGGEGLPADVLEAAAKEYVKDDFKTPDDFQQALVRFSGDISFDIATIAVADRHSRSGKTFVYRFSHRSAFQKGPEWLVTDHGCEAPHVFGFTLREGIPDEASAEDVQLCHQTMSYWVNFAKTGDPNGEGLVHWPMYNEKTKEHLVLKLRPVAESHMNRERIEFWRQRTPEMFP
jgi:carboxylesterase 2